MLEDRSSTTQVSSNDDYPGTWGFHGTRIYYSFFYEYDWCECFVSCSSSCGAGAPGPALAAGHRGRDCGEYRRAAAHNGMGMLVLHNFNPLAPAAR
jgi:hypothetical protein